MAKQIKKEEIAKEEQTTEKQEFEVVNRNAADVKSIVTRLNRVTGQISGVKRMLEEGRSCDDLLVQLSAITSVVNNIKLSLIKEIAIKHGQKAIKKEDSMAYDDMIDAIRKYL